MMIKYFFITILSLSTVVSYSQTKNCIQKMYAFYGIRIPGIIPVDPNGEPLYHGPDKTYLIYVETNGNEIQWGNAWINGKTYSVRSVLLNDFPVEVGTRKTNHQKISIAPAGKNKLWQLEIMPSGKKIKPPAKAKKNEIILEGKCKGKIIEKITKQIELELPPSV